METATSIFEFEMRNETGDTFGRMGHIKKQQNHENHISKDMDLENPKGCNGDRKKVTSYIAQYPVLEAAQRSFTLFPWQTWSIKYRLNFSGKHPPICYN